MAAPWPPTTITATARPCAQAMAKHWQSRRQEAVPYVAYISIYRGNLYFYVKHCSSDHQNWPGFSMCVAPNCQIFVRIATAFSRFHSIWGNQSRTESDVTGVVFSNQHGAMFGGNTDITEQGPWIEEAGTFNC